MNTALELVRRAILVAIAAVAVTSPASAHAQDKPVVGLIPKVQKPLKFDGKLADWDGAFVTPVHVGQGRRGHRHGVRVMQ